MKCPNCGKEMKHDFCIVCGYMNNGNIIHKNTAEHENKKLENYLGLEYEKINTNANSLLVFILGPLYFSYRNCILLGTVLSFVDIFINILIIWFMCFIPFVNRVLPLFMFITIFITRMIYVTFSNEVYLKICRARVNKTSDLELNVYNKNNKSIFSFLLSILIIFIIFLVSFFIYQIVK